MKKLVDVIEKIDEYQVESSSGKYYGCSDIVTFVGIGMMLLVGLVFVVVLILMSL